MGRGAASAGPQRWGGGYSGLGRSQLRGRMKMTPSELSLHFSPVCPARVDCTTFNSERKKKATGSHKFYWTMRGRDGKCWEIKWVSQGPQVNQSFISATIALIWSTSSWSEPRGINVSKKGKRRNQFPCHWSLLPINTSPAISWGNLGTTEQPSLTLL